MYAVEPPPSTVDKSVSMRFNHGPVLFHLDSWLKQMTELKHGGGIRLSPFVCAGARHSLRLRSFGVAAPERSQPQSPNPNMTRSPKPTPTS